MVCCSFCNSQLRNSRAASGCGEPLKVAAVCAQIGVGSTSEKAIAIGLPAFFSRSDRFGLLSIVTMLSPAEIERDTPRWPWMKLAPLAMYLSIQSQP